MKIANIDHRTIWPDPDDPRIIKIIDQRHLPHQVVIEELQNVTDFSRAIQEMHVRGAGLIGATAGFGMYSASLAAATTNLDETLQGAARQLIATRPTATNLAWAVNRQLAAAATVKGRENQTAKLFATAVEIANEDAEFCHRLGAHGLEIIREISRKKQGAPVNILTHCNAGWLAFVDYGSATAPIYAAHRTGLQVHVWVDETRPWLQGAKLTAWELKEEGVPHTLVVDNTGGHLMQHGLVDLVIVGTDRTTRTGDVANKIGTYLKALAAFDNQVPFYVALPSSTFDWTISDGVKEIPIEERGGEEICQISGLTETGRIEKILIAPPDTATANYSFDVTPARLVTGLITERGVCPASEEGIRQLYPEQFNN